MLSIETTQIVLPTYQRGPDSPWLPLSFGGRLRQRTVWPYHAQDDIDIATMRRDDTCRHTAVRLSNGLLEATVLPGMNGRLYSLRDLRSGRELFYRNHVVKPALVALRGAWLSGGVEFNFPTLGHTVSTVSPVFHRCIEGRREVAVVVGDIDRSTGQRWQVRMGLREGRAALDVDLTLANPNPWRERLYYWENAAVPAAADMRFVCRCDWTVGTPSLPFPMRDGIDRSLHVNNPTPLDHFGYRSHADVFGAYYSDRRLGTYHVAPRISLPGQKYFTWGTHEDNRIWQRFLTDDDGQYVEIQAGLLESQWFSDWLQPQEVARAHGSWFGTADMNELTWSTENLAVAATVTDDSLSVEVHSLDLTGRAVVALVQDDHSRRQSLEMAPGEVSRAVFPTTAPGWIEIRDRQGRLRFRRRWYGPETQSLDPQRDRRPPTQWCLRARRDTAVGQATVAAQYHRWHEARERLQADAPPLLALDRVLLLAEIDLKTGQPQAALERLHAALQETPDQPRLHAVAAAAAARLYRLEAQPAHYTAAWDHILAARRDPALAPAMLRLLADIEILAGHLPEAIPLLEAFLAARPDAIDARALLAAVHRHCGDRAAAKACLKDRAETPFILFLEIEALIQGLASPGRPATPAVEPLTLPELPADRPWGQVYRAAYVLEALLLYWRAGFHKDVLAYLDAAIKAGQPCGLHPLAALLAMDAAAALGLEDLARRYAILAGSAADWVVPATWEMVCLIDRARRRLPPEDHGALPLLAGAAAAENDRADEALELLSRAAEAPVGSARAVAARALAGTDTPELAPTREEMERIVGDVDDAHRTARALACKALADWYAGPGAQPGLAAAYLEKALALRADDRRLVLQLDEVWRTQHDTAHREALWATQPAAWADRGDVTFALARLDLDRGRAAAALDRLTARQFSVVEGGTSVRRLYVDALLVDAVDAFLRGDRALATARCQAVFEYPENLGAAGYLGEHSRLARCLLGLFAAQAGDRKAAETWWKDVLARAGSGVTYTVGGEGMAKAGRLDEQLAILLADRCLHGTALPTPAETAPADHPDGAARALVAAIAAGAPGRARSAEALARWPCDALLRILAQVARLDHTAHHA